MGNILYEIDTGISLDIQGKTLYDEKMPLTNNTLISDGNNFILNGIGFSINNKAAKDSIEEYLNRGTSHVCTVLNSDDKGNFLAKIMFFAGTPTEMGDIEIFVDPEKIDITGDWTKKAEDSSFTLKDQKYFIIQSSSENITYEECKKEDFKFSIIATEQNLDVRMVAFPLGYYCDVIRAYKRRNNAPQFNYHLVKGTFKINTTNKQKCFISNAVKGAMDELDKNTGTYLNEWKQYTEARANKVLKEAAEFGKKNFQRIERTRLGYKLFFKSPVGNIPYSNITICANDYPEPLFLSDPVCSFSDFVLKDKENKRQVKAENQKRKALKNNETVSQEEKKLLVQIEASVLDITENCISVQVEEDDYYKEQSFPNAGYITLSIKPEMVQIQRQADAWESIRTGKCGIQHLGLLIEDGAELPVKAHKRKAIPLSERIYNKIFEHEPNLAQREAIRLALETPDIALIQGPPGTGKTTVITAILECLNAMQDKHDLCAGKVLATAYQHVAVINMTGKLSINSSPTPKKGTKKFEEEYKDNIVAWRNKIIERIQNMSFDDSLEKSEEIFVNALRQYRNNPCIETEQELKTVIKNDSNIDIAIKNQLNDADFDDDENPKSIHSKGILKLVRALRIEPLSFGDDGKDRAFDLYVALEDSLNESQKKLLESACRDSAFKNFAELAQLKSVLLRKYSEEPSYIVYEDNQELLSLCDQIQDDYFKKKSGSDKKDIIIREWKNYIESNPFALEKAVDDCSFVYAATAQQVESRSMKAAMTDLGYGSINFDTVVVDEAARSSPPDLLIPMCKATKRIILVGDHRQLPQLVEEDICQQLEAEGLVDNKDDLMKLSLFEKLKRRMEELEKQDGIKRTITLNVQYRTNPILGRFASKEFYDDYGEGYDSTLKEELFAHNITGLNNKCALWVNVPAKGRNNDEKIINNSYCRPAELDAIKKLLNKWVNDENGKRLTYGIIPFYKEQVKLFEKDRDIKLLCNRQIEKKEKDGSTKVENQVSVGTVDAFQGMEFDVVILSLGRSNGKNGTKPRFGFLTVPNRLCVCMTRQKKLLVIVGDAEYASCEEARRPCLEGGIKPIADFYDLCCNDKDHGAILELGELE